MKAKYLLFGAAGLVAISAFSAKKGFDITELAGQLKTTLKAIRNVNFSTTGITAEIDVEITNPTDQQFSVASAGAIVLRKLLVYDKNNKLIATAETNITALSIASNSSVILPQIPLKSSFGSIIDSVFGGISTNPQDYIVVAEFEALGQTITV